jgi:hypothetical protein
LTQAALASGPRTPRASGRILAGDEGNYRTRNFAVKKINPRMARMTPLRGLERSGAPSVPKRRHPGADPCGYLAVVRQRITADMARERQSSKPSASNGTLLAIRSPRHRPSHQYWGAGAFAVSARDAAVTTNVRPPATRASDRVRAEAALAHGTRLSEAERDCWSRSTRRFGAHPRRVRGTSPTHPRRSVLP